MLSCKDLAHHAASDYLDGQLNWRQRLAVKLHLFMCVHCRRFIHQLQQARALLRRRAGQQTDALPRPTTPDEQPASPDEKALQDLAAALKDEYEISQNHQNK